MKHNVVPETESEIVVRMPAKRSYAITLRVGKIARAMPQVTLEIEGQE